LAFITQQAQAPPLFSAHDEAGGQLPTPRGHPARAENEDQRPGTGRDVPALPAMFALALHAIGYELYSLQDPGNRVRLWSQ
jgi:hypothetical protein